MTTPDEDPDSDAGSRWSLLGVGGALSLCCLFAAPAVSGVAGGTAAGGTAAALGGGVVQVLVAALTVGLIGVVVRLRSDDG